MTEKFSAKIQSHCDVVCDQMYALKYFLEIVSQIEEQTNDLHEDSVLAHIRKAKNGARLFNVLEQAVVIVPLSRLRDAEKQPIDLFSVAVSALVSQVYVVRQMDGIHSAFGTLPPCDPFALDDESEEHSYGAFHVNKRQIVPICLAEIIAFLLARIRCTDELLHAIRGAAALGDLCQEDAVRLCSDAHEDSESISESELIGKEKDLGDELLRIASYINRQPFYPLIEKLATKLLKEENNYALERTGNDREGKAHFVKVRKGKRALE